MTERTTTVIPPQASIILMGGTGTGKTTFVNLVGGSQFLAGDGLESCTERVQLHKFAFEGKEVTLIDVPGFDDTSKSDIDVLKIITEFLVSEHQAKRNLNGVLYFHRISDVRMGGASKRNYTMFQKLCGAEALKNVAIVTTRWDQEQEAIALARLKELKIKPQLFKPILDGGGEIFRHNRSIESANAILHHLISKDAMPLLIQRELVEESKELAKTAAGEELHRDIIKQEERHQKELAELMEEMEQIQEGSENADLERELEELRERMAHWHAESEKLAGAGKPSEALAVDPSTPGVGALESPNAKGSIPPRPSKQEARVTVGDEATTADLQNKLEGTWSLKDLIDGTKRWGYPALIAVLEFVTTKVKDLQSKQSSR